MAGETPYDWLVDLAHTDPDRVCLVGLDGALSYADVLLSVRERASVLSAGIGPHQIVPVQVSIDAESIVELLATQVAGGVPLPFVGRPPEVPLTRAEGAAICVATSGSGGTPKIVPLTYGSIESSVRASRERLGNAADDRWLVCLPLNHVGGLSIVWRSLESGGVIVVAPFDATGETIETLEPTIASMVPTMVHRLLENNPPAIASIRTVLVGGAALTPSIWSRATASGVRLVPTYGMTEAGSQIATLAPHDERREPGLVGRPLDGFIVTIVDSVGAEVARGSTGRIAVDGPAMFSGYLGRRPVPRPFVTGDLGRITAEGDLYVEGRIDDVVVTGGENVSTDHVSDIIGRIDGVHDVCVVSLEDSEWGSIVAAMVVADQSIDSHDTMVEMLLDRQERPKRWIVTDEIPKLHNGKHDVRAVRAAFKEES
jgi:O-succinylbenzoic acid--CoA ligase